MRSKYQSSIVAMRIDISRSNVVLMDCQPVSDQYHFTIYIYLLWHGRKSIQIETKTDPIRSTT